MKKQNDVVFTIAEIKEMNQKFVADTISHSAETLATLKDFDDKLTFLKNVVLSFRERMTNGEHIQFWCDFVSDDWWKDEIDNVLCEISTEGMIERIWVASKEIENSK